MKSNINIIINFFSRYTNNAIFQTKIANTPFEPKRLEFIDNRLNSYKNRLAKSFLTLPFHAFDQKGREFEVSTNTNPHDLYKEYQTVLILGEAGMGKTQTLLDIAVKELELTKKQLENGNSKDICIPVIFTLTAWSEDDHDLLTWLVENLQSAYNFPPDEARKSLKKGEIIPFLDGFENIGKVFGKEKEDEKQKRRKNCLQAIANFIQDINPNLILCSRKEEYEEIKQIIYTPDVPAKSPVKIDIHLDKLSDDSIRKNFTELLVKKLHQNPAAIDRLQDMAKQQDLKQVIQTPFYFDLLLRIFSSTTESVDFLDEPIYKQNYLISKGYSSALARYSVFFAGKEIPTQEALQHSIIGTFVYTRLKDTSLYNAKSLHHLRQLAIQLTQNERNLRKQNYFELSDFHAGMLEDEKSIGLYINLLGLWFVFVYHLAIYLMGDELHWSFITPLFAGYFSAIIYPHIHTIDKSRYNFFSLFKKDGIIALAIFVILSFFFYGAIALYYWYSGFGDMRSEVFFMTLFGGVLSLLLGVIVVTRESYPFSETSSPYQRLFRELRVNTFLIPFAAAGIAMFISIFAFKAGFENSSLFQLLFMCWMPSHFLSVFGYLYGSGFFKHFILRVCFWIEGSMPLRWRSFFNTCSQVGILEKDGGGWRFRHQLLQDYFAGL